MSLRRRLFLFVFIPIAVLYYAVGIYGVYQTRAQLVDDLDADLVSVSTTSANLLGPLSDQEILALGQDSRNDSTRLTALVDVGTAEVFVSPATVDGEQQTPPAIDELKPSQLVNQLDEVFTIASADDSVDYRAIATRIDGGRLIVTAQGLDRIDALTRQFLIGTLFTGLVILAAMAAVVYLAVRSGLRPLRRFIETTTRVAEGDLTERVDTNQADPNFNQIAHATNHMLDQVEVSYEQQRLGRQRLNELVASAAHELRTPLTAIRGTVDMRHMGAISTDDQLRTAFRGIDEHSTRMASIVEDLIVIARSENVRLDTQTQTTSIVDLKTLTESLVSSFAAAHPGRSVTFSSTGDNHEVQGDDALLVTAVGNILDNAATHTPDGTSIQIGVQSDDQYTRLTFSDAGPGVPGEISDRVFERFVRGDSSRARSTGGAGLGLGVVQSIVESTGGSIELTSNTSDGCVFVVTLPRYQRSTGAV